MKLEKVSLFSNKKDFFLFLLLCLSILSYSLLIEYQNFKQLTRFDTAIVDATVIKHYEKTKDSKTYQVLKLKSEQGFMFYTTSRKNLQNLTGKKLSLEIYTTHITFLNFFTYFYAYSFIEDISQTKSLKEKLNTTIDDAHKDKNISNIYQALYTATPLNKDLQTTFSSLGVSHLLAISGFHLGVLSALLLFLLKYPYQFLQNKYFPYRNSKRDIFIIISLVLLSYLLFLDSPPSLLRAFFMLIIGFILYDRGIKIISMQSLLLTVMILLSFSPRLFFSLGFWLSISGVFYIFLFLIHFKNLSKIWQFILVPIWVYLMMLPFSLSIFGNFSIYHPLSIIWTSLFTIFYPLSIFLHLIGFGDLFDNILKSFISLNQNNITLKFDFLYLFVHILLSFLAIKIQRVTFILLFFSFCIFFYLIT
ncbi:MAG: ComEC/Rec2 family competence protein [Campylobacterota bacterium]|nr:ComEC/Rec2 family competence protein [Campylobacterota bacterium]